MAEAPLRDQMGAMALIDEMRHKQMIVQEHLDLPKRREEVVRRIREYYRSQNIEVSDELVEQGGFVHAKLDSPSAVVAAKSMA